MEELRALKDDFSTALKKASATVEPLAIKATSENTAPSISGASKVSVADTLANLSQFMQSGFGNLNRKNETNFNELAS